MKNVRSASPPRLQRNKEMAVGRAASDVPAAEGECGDTGPNALVRAHAAACDLQVAERRRKLQTMRRPTAK